MTETRPAIDRSVVPPEINRWNWGAFFLNWIWGIGNNTYIALLTLVPFFGILVMPFVLGAKGNAWAWRNGRWDSVEHFKQVQRKWAMWGTILVMAWLALVVGAVGSVFYMLPKSEAYQLGVSTLNTSAEATGALGAPISAGFPWGNIAIAGSAGTATLTFSATGSKNSGQVYLEAVKRNGSWSLKTLTLRPNGSDKAIDLMKEWRAETGGMSGRTG